MNFPVNVLTCFESLATITSNLLVLSLSLSIFVLFHRRARKFTRWCTWRNGLCVSIQGEDWHHVNLLVWTVCQQCQGAGEKLQVYLSWLAVLGDNLVCQLLVPKLQCCWNNWLCNHCHCVLRTVQWSCLLLILDMFFCEGMLYVRCIFTHVCEYVCSVGIRCVTT